MSEVYILDSNGDLLAVMTSETGIESAQFREELNRGSSFTLIVDATAENAKYIVEENQVVFTDKEGDLRLYVIKEIDDLDNDNGAFTQATCEPAFMELIEKIIVDRRFTDKEALDALTAALEGTRWEPVVEVSLGLASTNFYYISSVDAIWKILDKWGGDFKDVVEFTGNKVTRRIIKIVQRRGKDTGKIFDVNYDIEEIERTVLSYPITALYGRGASLELEDEDGNATGGYSRLIDFADIEWKVANGDPVDKPLGQKWVGNPDALQQYGRKDNSGKLLHREAIWENGDIEDPAKLLQETWKKLQDVGKPEINYRMTVHLLEQIAGYEHEKVSLGDTTRAVDHNFARPIEVQSRVIVIEYDVLDIEGTGIVEIGEFISAYEEDDRLDRVIEYINDNRGKWENGGKPPVIDDRNFPDLKPAKPKNLVANGLFKVINLKWDYDASSFIAAYEIYASQVDNFIPQVQHMVWRGKSGGFSFKADLDEVWYFRVRAINTHGTASDYSDQATARTQRLSEVDFDELTVLDAFIQTLSADVLFGGTIDANEIEVINLKAQHLTINEMTTFAEGYNPLQNLEISMETLQQHVSPEGISTVITESVFYESLLQMLAEKANSEDIADLPTREELEGIAGGIDERIAKAIEEFEFTDFVTKTELDEKAGKISAGFYIGGGINLVRNSTGYADFEFWTRSTTSSAVFKITSDESLEGLGFDYGFELNTHTASKSINQVINVIPNVVHTLSFYAYKEGTPETLNRMLGIVYDTDDGTFVNEITRITLDQTDESNYDRHQITFVPTSSKVTVRLFGDANLNKAVFAGAMVNIGNVALQWSMHTQEIYNTNIKLDIKGIQVAQREDDLVTGYTVMTPTKFAGYYNQEGNINESNNSPDEVFRMDRDEFIMNKAVIRPIKIIPITSGGYSGIAFVGE